jgi:subtilisin family serine protease
MRNNLLLTFLAIVLLATSCSDEAIQTETMNTKAPLQKADIDRFVNQQLEQKGEFWWSAADDHLLWSAAVRSDSIVSIGYQPINEKNLNERLHLIDVQDHAWKKVRTDLLNLIVTETNRLNPGKNYTAKDLLPFGEEEVLPFFTVKIWDEQLLAQLRQRPDVRYLDAIGYLTEDMEVRLRSDSGCDAEPDAVAASEYTTVSPNVKIPWNFYNMNIPNAWSQSTGAGIGVALIDTGTSPDQPKLGSQFNQGQSVGRSLTRLGFYVSSWFGSTPDGPNDRCGHGTQMAGLIAAPRGTDGTTVGVAYNCNLVAMRAVADVVILGSAETNGVSNALRNAADRSNVRIISMSIGTPFSSGQIADAVRYAYGRGKLIFAAAGTSTSFTSWYGVIFPATMAEAVAVTGVKEGTPLTACDVCHVGSKVELVAPMQRRTSDMTSLTLAFYGNTPTTIGGSSAATATTAGVAALVWARNAGQTRAQVLDKMRRAASLYPSRNGSYGYGVVDAVKAVSAN